MKSQIHPTYHVTEVTCGCGASFVTRSTKPVIKLEICSSCHPFFTGRQKFVDTAGRVEKFTRKFGWTFDQSGEGAAADGAKVEKKARAKKDEGERETFKSLAKKTKKALADGAKKQLAAKAEAEGAAAAEAAPAGASE